MVKNIMVWQKKLLQEKFWQEKTLDEMNEEEWEALCDGCGRCCLVKLEDEDSGEILKSDIHCKLFDCETAKCLKYENRQEYVSDCVRLTPKNIKELNWIPDSCAYRRIAEGRGLSWWHPLVCGESETIKEVGVSVIGRTICESEIKPDEFVNHIAYWPDFEPEEK